MFSIFQTCFVNFADFNERMVLFLGWWVGARKTKQQYEGFKECVKVNIGEIIFCYAAPFGRSVLAEFQVPRFDSLRIG